MIPEDKALSASSPSFDSYEGVASELEHIAGLLRERPELNHHAAERLLKIAQDIRSDLQRLGGSSAGSGLP